MNEKRLGLHENMGSNIVLKKIVFNIVTNYPIGSDNSIGDPQLPKVSICPYFNPMLHLTMLSVSTLLSLSKYSLHYLSLFSAFNSTVNLFSTK